MILNRLLQNDLLKGLATHYPYQTEMAYLDSEVITKYFEQIEANLAYLEEHGLITCQHPNPHSPERLLSKLNITARGMDFLADDGGLTAILGTVTVKLHADTVRDLLETKVMTSDLPPEEKRRIADTLKDLPGEALKIVTNKLVEKGLEALSNPQSILSLVQGVIN